LTAQFLRKIDFLSEFTDQRLATRLTILLRLVTADDVAVRFVDSLNFSCIALLLLLKLNVKLLAPLELLSLLRAVDGTLRLWRMRQ
jgi:hypothetical protein